MIRVLVVDNYASFVDTLVQYLGQFGADCVVLRNDEPGATDVAACRCRMRGSWSCRGASPARWWSWARPPRSTLAEGDLLRPTGEAGSASVDSQVVWQVLEPTRLAVLDRDFLLSVQPWPEVTAALLRRQERRAELLSNVIAIIHLPCVELRVLVLFWQFADRGKVRGGEVSVTIPLTYLNVARLIGARRPTVTTALGRLAKAGLVVQEGNGSLAAARRPASAAARRARRHRCGRTVS